mmetsp:Transcript_5830/g.9989  ORF Transcript_5830/g.9989 Transcript_5830/m.9989 type:complete len:221 (-) Transcript_5830:1718-2380(-)
MRSHLILLKQKPIMPRITMNNLQLGMGHPSNQLLLLPQRIKHIGINPQNAHGNLHMPQNLLNRPPPPSTNIVRIHLLRQLDIRHGIKPIQKLLPLILQITLHLPRRPAPVTRPALVRQRPPELPMIPQRRAVGHHGHLPRHAKSPAGRIVGIVSSVFVPFGIGVDGLALGFADADLPCGVGGAAGYGDGGADEGFDAAVAFGDEFSDAVGCGAAVFVSDE